MLGWRGCKVNLQTGFCGVVFADKWGRGGRGAIHNVCIYICLGRT